MVAKHGVRMKRTASTLLLCGGLSAILAAEPATGQTPKAERPTYRIGDQWILQDGVYDLIQVERDNTYVFALGPGRQIHLSRDLVIAKVTKNRRVEWEFSGPPPLTWPLQVGKWGVYSTTLKTPDRPSGLKVGVTWEVKAHEPVQTPAGAFQAFKVVHTIQAETPDRRRLVGVPYRTQWSVTTWYAPEPRLIVKVASDTEALSFQVVALVRPPTVAATGAPAGAPVAASRPTPPGPATAPPPAGAPAQPSAATPPPRPPEPSSASPTPSSQGSSPAQPGQATSPSPSTGSAPAAGAVPTPPSSAPAASAVPKPPNMTPAAPPTAASPAAGSSQNPASVTRPSAEPSTPAVAAQRPTSEAPAAAVPSAPLSVEVRYPEDRSRVTEASSVVAALITSSRGVAKVSVTLNGESQVIPGGIEPETPNRTSVAVTVPVTLRPGINAIVVSATEPDGTARHEIRTITYELSAVPPQPEPAPTPRAQERWAVVVGVSQYERPEIPNLRYAIADAEAIHDALIANAGFKKENVLLLTDRSEKTPTLRNIKWALGTFLARSAARDDLVIIYFAGHGAPEVDPRGIESDGLAKYLVPIDADPNDLYSTALPMDELQTIFDRIEAQRIVVFLDACYSGAAGGRTFASKRTRATKVDDVFLERLTRSSGRAIITASRASEVSIELPELGHGIFTHYLLQGLKGTGDLDRDGIVLLQELYQYLEQQVTQKSRAVGGNQHPVIKGELEGLLPLVKLGGRPER